MVKFFQIIIICLCIVNFSGCAAVLIGAGIAGGLAISEDTVRYDIDRSYSKCWDVAYSEAKRMGTVTLKDKDAGRIEATVQNSHVWIYTKKLTEKTVRIEVKCRKNMFPNINLSHEMMNKITKRL